MNPGALRRECSYLQDGSQDRWRVTQTVDNFISRFLLQTVESYQEAGLGEQLTHGHRTQKGSQSGRKSCLSSVDIAFVFAKLKKPKGHIIETRSHYVVQKLTILLPLPPGC